MADTDTTVPALPESWVTYITPFAKAIGKTVPETTEALRSLVGQPKDEAEAAEAIATFQSETFAPFDEIKAAVGADVPTGKLRKVVASLRKAAVKETPAPVAMTPMFNTSALPTVPTDDNWLNALKIGGVLKFNRETVIGTVSAALAERAGLYDLPKKIVDAMESHSASLEEPVPAEFFAVQKSLTERSYAEIFAAIPGATGRYAT